MRQKTDPFVIVNPWFIIPFLLWVLGGGIALLIYSQEELFRFFNSNTSTFLNALVPYVTRIGEGLAITLLSLLPLLYKRFRNKAYLLIAISVPLLVVLVTQMIKRELNIPRPLAVYGDETWFHRLSDWKAIYHYSFPSGHTSSAFALFTLLSLVLPKQWQMFGLHFFLLALLVAYSRMYLAAHFFMDVYVGSLLGTLLSLSTVLILHRKKVLH